MRRKLELEQMRLKAKESVMKKMTGTNKKMEKRMEVREYLRKNTNKEI